MVSEVDASGHANGGGRSCMAVAAPVAAVALSLTALVAGLAVAAVAVLFRQDWEATDEAA